MELTIKTKYLVFPVNTLAKKKKLSFCSESEELYSLDLNLDNINPDFFAYVDLSRFIGSTLEVSVLPDMPLCFRGTDAIDAPDIYREPYRPLVHFTTKNGWINDPNGLIYLDGIYHLFYQHNPASTAWGNMHWGHAVSTDMLRWREVDIALFPDNTGAMFSGSAVLDTENRSRLGSKKAPPVLLYYTATSPYSQYLAYSTDGLSTVKKYGEAIIPRITEYNRDPKVVFVKEWNAYAMSLYMEDDRYAIFRSDDLIHWDMFDSVRLDGDNECPDLFPITDSEGVRRWVLIGAHDRYLVGDMTDRGFSPLGEAKPLHFGRSSYAAQTFSNLPSGRVVRMSWMKQGAKRGPFAGQMSIPCELSLTALGGEYYLAATPISEINGLVKEREVRSDLRLSCDAPLRLHLDKTAYIVKLKAGKASADLALTLFGRTLTLNAKENILTFGCDGIPLSVSEGGVDLIVISDRLSLEIYLDGGRIFASYMDEDSSADYNLSYLELSSSGEFKIDILELSSLRSIWEE